MERVNENAGLELLQRANVCLTGFFEQFFDTPSYGSDEELRALVQLHETLESVRAWLDGRLQNATNHDLREALRGYRENLIRLRRQLAIMQEDTLTARSHLDSEREHLASARAWCAASRAIS